MRIVYMGTPEFAVNPLKKLDENYEVVMVVTQPDKEVGRKKEIRFSDVKKYALDHNIEVFQPEKIRTDYQRIIDANPDLIVTCAYGQIIPKELLEYPKYKCINIHASLLPKLRGGAPIHWSIINGDSKTGITIMYMNEKMDEGDILYQKEVEILDSDNVESLHDKLSELGSNMILEFIPMLENGEFTPIKQNNEEATYGYNVTREDEHLNFNKTSREVFNQIRGLNPWPVAYTNLDGKVFKVYSSRISDKNPLGENGEITNIYSDGIGVKTSDGEIIITEIKEEGKNRILVKDYLNGIHDKDSLLHKIFS